MKPVNLPIDAVIVGTRIRKDYGDVDDLVESIKEVGLIQPLVIDEKKNLIAGGRRYAALTKLGWKEVPVVMHDIEGSEIKLRMMELEENIRRKEMTWKEMVASVAEVHKLHAREAAKNSESWSRKATGKLLGISEGNVHYCVVMAAHLQDPNHPVQKADSLMEAFRILTQLKEDEVVKLQSTFAADVLAGSSKGTQAPGATLSIDALVNTIAAAVGESSLVVEGHEAPLTTEAPPVGRPVMNIELSRYLLKGSCLDHMAAMEPGSVHHIITDSPYAIDMDNLEQNTGTMNVERVRDEHDVEENLSLMERFFPAAHRVIKDPGFLIVWYDYQHHAHMVNLATSAGFKVCRWPLTWVKTHRCKNEAAAYNFTKATEVALIARKGNATLVAPQLVNYWIGSNDETRAQFNHPFVKPAELWRWLFNAVASKGQIIYDPFAGVGSGILTAARAGYFPRASELNELHYNRLVANFKDLMINWYGKTHELNFV